MAPLNDTENKYILNLASHILSYCSEKRDEIHNRTRIRSKLNFTFGMPHSQSLGANCLRANVSKRMYAYLLKHKHSVGYK